MKRRKAAYKIKYANHPKKFWKPDPEKQAKENELFIFQSEINRTEEKFLKRLPKEADPTDHQKRLLDQILSEPASQLQSVNESQIPEE